MIIAVRLRGSIKVNREIRATMDMLGLKKVNTLVVLPENPSAMGMLKKAESFITYGKVSDEDAKSFGKTMRLKPRKGGLRSIKKKYPKGDTGDRGEAIIDFVKGR